jgi:preprotein translocase subunit YajC
MFVSPAYAQAAGGGPAGFELVSFLPLILIFVVFWFLMIRPQQKKMKQHREMIAAIRRGDRVLTSGGIFGTVTKVLGESELQVEISDGVRVRVARGTISEVLAKTEPAKGSAAEDDEEEEVEKTSEVKGRSAKG